MSGETEQNVSGWTVDTLHSHLVRMLAAEVHRIDDRHDAANATRREMDMASEKAIAAALAAAREATLKSEGATDRRFELANEFRASLDDATSKAIPRVEADARFTAVTEKIETMQALSAERLDGLNLQIAQIASRLDTMAGERAGVSSSWGYLAGAIGLAAAVIGIILGFNG